MVVIEHVDPSQACFKEPAPVWRFFKAAIALELRGGMNETNAVTSLGALAHENRLRIFRLLVRQGLSGMPAGDIAHQVSISPTNTSFHLKELDRAGWVRATLHGRFVRCAIDVESMRGLVAFLAEDCLPGSN
jgi:ArsR family transcriptional regulator, arsenate/arsenite/antimonite-responsive transcriptional repressor